MRLGLHGRALGWLALLAAQTSAQEVLSANGRFVAHLRPPSGPAAPTEIEVVDREGGERPVWKVNLPKVNFPKLIRADEWRLADDGLALAAIDSKGKAGLPLVQVVREGRLLLSAGADALAVPSDLLGGWLPLAAPCIRVRGVERDGARAYWLDLLARDHRVRSIDLATGAIRLPRFDAVTGPPRVEPAASASLELAFVTTWFAPEVCFASDPLPVHVRGSLPTPAWKLAGFTLDRGGEGSGQLLLAPRMDPPPPGTISIQVLKGYEETASLVGLEPDLYRLSVRGRGAEDASVRPDVRDLRVIPPGIVVWLEKSGGIAGVRESVALFDDGRVETSANPHSPRRVALAGEAEQASLSRALARLPVAPAKRPQSPGADLFRYELVWIAGGYPVRAVRDDSNLEPELRECVQALESFVVQPERRARYAIDLAKSFLEVRTGSAGLLSAFGHDHKLMVRRFSGRMDVDPADLASAFLELEIEAGSLAVVDDDSQKDRAEIEREMNESVLAVARHPKIEFRSVSVDSTPTVDGAFDVVVHGELSLHGKKRMLHVPGRLEVRGDDLRAVGAISILQSDFGIEPVSAAGGTVKVADKVRIGFNVTAVRETARGR